VDPLKTELWDRVWDYCKGLKKPVTVATVSADAEESPDIWKCVSCGVTINAPGDDEEPWLCGKCKEGAPTWG
jgi:heterodisulfide reductase subunit C